MGVHFCDQCLRSGEASSYFEGRAAVLDDDAAELQEQA
jgi:hypothetical protein